MFYVILRVVKERSIIMKRIPVGIENFKEMIDDQYYYIDKTELINDVMNEKLVLYTRPRRFGKTLNMSMLYYFFSHKEKDNAYLFDGLNVSKDKETMLHQNQYPVIFMTLKDMKRTDYHQQIDKFASLISDITKKIQSFIPVPILMTMIKIS